MNGSENNWSAHRRLVCPLFLIDKRAPDKSCMQLAFVSRSNTGCLVPMFRFVLALGPDTCMSLNNATPPLLSKCYLLKTPENPYNTESDCVKFQRTES